MDSGYITLARRTCGSSTTADKLAYLETPVDSSCAPLFLARSEETVMFNDEYLDYWGKVFVVARLLEQGIPFQEFLEDPRGSLKVVGFQFAPPSVACGYRPLLPRQVKVAQALWRQWNQESDGDGKVTPTLDARLALVEEEDSEP
jgi:hypothetical protein